MKPQTFGRRSISIRLIGLRRFWGSILLGVFMAMILCAFFAYSREYLRASTGFDSDLLVLTDSQHWFWDYFYAALAVNLGFSVTVYGWLSVRFSASRRARRYMLYGRTLIALYFSVVLACLMRYSHLLVYILGERGHDASAGISGEYGSAIFSIPLFVYLLNWSAIRRVYQSLRWMAYSLLVVFGLSFSLAHVFHISQEGINVNYSAQYIRYFDFVDREVIRGEKEYGIRFSEESIARMKERYTQGSAEQLYELRDAFGQDKEVSMETILLEGMAIQSRKREGSYLDGPSSTYENWQFAYPEDIYQQLLKVDPESHSALELVRLMKGLIDFRNYDMYHEDGDSFHSQWIFHARRRAPKEVVAQLLDIRRRLLSDERYYEWAVQLPHVIQVDSNGELLLNGESR